MQNDIHTGPRLADETKQQLARAPLQDAAMRARTRPKFAKTYLTHQCDASNVLVDVDTQPRAVDAASMMAEMNEIVEQESLAAAPSPARALAASASVSSMSEKDGSIISEMNDIVEQELLAAAPSPTRASTAPLPTCEGGATCG